jgi:short subunit dehydrogenase-like uncharacterized protein
VFALVQTGDVLVSTVGPFGRWGEPAVRAAIAAKAVYLDSAGEPAFIRRVFEDFGPLAERDGATLLPAMGFDFVPGALAGGLALREAGEDAVRVDVGYWSFGMGAGSLSAGTKRSLAGAMLEAGFAFRAGGLRTALAAERVRSFPVKGRKRGAISVGGAEHFTLPAAYPRLREVNVYFGAPGPLARPAQAATLAGSFALRIPGMRPAVQFAGDRLAGLLRAPEPGTTPDGLTWVVAEVYDDAGERLAAVHLSGAEPYTFTSRFLAWAARRAAAEATRPGAGALGPIEAFGLDVVQEGCAEAGIARTSE